MVHVTEIAFLVAVFALLIYCHKLRVGAVEKFNSVMQLRSQNDQARSDNESLQQELVNCRNSVCRAPADKPAS